MKRVCIVGASGKLGRHMVQHALDRDYEVVGVCRERSVGKLDVFRGRITVFPGATNIRTGSGTPSPSRICATTATSSPCRNCSVTPTWRW